MSLNSWSLNFVNGEHNPSGLLGKKDEKNILSEQSAVCYFSKYCSFVRSFIQVLSAFYGLDSVEVLGHRSEQNSLPS